MKTKTYEQQIKQNRLLVLTAMAVITLAMVGTFWFQSNSSESEEATISQQDPEMVNATIRIKSLKIED